MEKSLENTGKKGRKLGRFFLNLGKLAVDIAKLCFASLMLGTIIRGEIPHETLMFVGIVSSGICAFIGVLMVSIFEEK